MRLEDKINEVLGDFEKGVDKINQNPEMKPIMDEMQMLLGKRDLEGLRNLQDRISAILKIKKTKCQSK